MTSNFTESDLKKFTVPQLKLMCKEKRVIGYSKLTKDAIIAKFLDLQKTSGVSGTSDLARHNTSTVTLHEVPSAGSAHALTNTDETVNASLIPGPLLHSVKLTQVTPVDTTRENLGSNAISDKSFISEALKKQSDARLKRPRTEASFFENTSEETKQDDIQLTIPRSHGDKLRSGFSKESSIGGGKNQEEKEKSHNVREVTDTGRPRKQGLSDFSKPAAKRFKALIPKALVGSVTGMSHSIHSVTAAQNKRPTSNYNLHASCLDYGSRHLDFPAPGDLASLIAISFPPMVSQRKHVARLSLILSAISFEDLKSCSLVSRVFRYSAYLSAFHQLLRRFPGKRLQDVLGRYPSNMTNLWPYLCLRDREMDIRRGIYEQSFLLGALKGVFEIDEILWSSPNHEKQLTIAVRFLMTKLYFMLSVGHCGEESRQTGKIGRVVDAQEIVENEIWKITYCSTTSTHTFYVLQDTCEVIGESTTSSITSISLQPQTNLRMDWAAYIETVATRNTDAGRISLSKRLHWTNHEEYEHGISKIWLKRIQGEGETGSEKLKIATRYIFACVIGNSISGPWRTANEMAQEFDGRSSMSDTRKHQIQKLCLFLPGHHHVESIHFTTRYDHALHPALAVVQTPGREYFILKDNGMQVGCEEEGVGLVWMGLLRCTSAGCPKL